MSEQPASHPAPAPRGRPVFVPTDEERKLVEELSGHGLPREQICALVRDGIDDDTLRKHFGRELAEGKAKANSGVGKRLWQKAMDGDTASLIWWTKTQMRWKEEQNTQQAAPVTINLAWLPAREVDIGANMVGVIEGQAQTIGNAGELVQDLRADDTKASE